MAIAVILTFPGGTQGMYDAVQAQLGIPQNWIPDGLISHSAGPVDDGWRVIDIWRSQEDFESQIPEKVIPATQAYGQENGIDIQPPTIEFAPIVNVYARDSEAVLA